MSKETVTYGMVNIDSDNIAYANIKDMYKDGNGAGLQVNLSEKGNKKSVLKICDEIAGLFYTLEQHLKDNGGGYE